MMCGSARLRAHCAGSVGSNGFWESNGIGSPAVAGARKEKSSRGREPLLVRRVEQWAWIAAAMWWRSAFGGQVRFCAVTWRQSSTASRRAAARERVILRYARGWAAGYAPLRAADLLERIWAAL